MKELEPYSPFDTVEVTYTRLISNTYNLKSFLLSYRIKNKSDECYSDVFVGLANKKNYTFMGDYIMLKTTRMVLIEKYDYKLNTTRNILAKKYNFALTGLFL